MTYFLYVLGLLPSIIWLAFYLRKDSHPESNRMVLKIFLFGVVSAAVAIILEKSFRYGTKFLEDAGAINAIAAVFLGGALIEEYVKFLAVRLGAFRDKELDEPIDLILYMIISALGFAALENILVLSSLHPFLTGAKAVEAMLWRFVSATFLHALSSALVGYFLVLAFCRIKKKKWLIPLGIILSTLLHGLYNFSIMKADGFERYLIPLSILVILYFFVSFAFKRTKRLEYLNADIARR